MWVYLLGTLLYVVLTYLFYQVKTRKDKFNSKIMYKISYAFLFLASIAPLTLIAGLRYNVGTDYMHTYAPHFRDIFVETDEIFYNEVLFVYVNELLHLITANDVILFMFMASVFSVFMQLTIIKLSPSWWMSAFLVVFSNMFFVSLNQSRQMMCVAILAYAASFIHEKKVLPFLFWTLFATLFHYASLVLLPFYFIINFKYFRKYALAIFLAVFALMPVITLGVEKLTLMTKYKYYFLDPFYNRDQSILPYFISSFTVEVAGILWYPKMKNKFGSLAFSMLVINGFATLIAYAGFYIRIPELMARTYMLFAFSQVILVPIIILSEDNKWIRLGLFAALMGVEVYASLFVILVQHHHEILPYDWVFNR